MTGSIRLDGIELTSLPGKQLRAVRGRQIAMVSQDPTTSLHPILPIGTQLTEHMRHHLGVDKAEALSRAAGLLQTAALLARPGVFVTPTLCVTRSEPWMRAHGFEEHSIRNASQAADVHLASVRRAIRAGVTLVNGTDIPPGDLVGGTPAAVHELLLMAAAGLSPLLSLQSVSVNAAALRTITPPESKHALDLETLREPGITFWSVMDDGSVVGCGALKRLDARHAEV